MPTTSSTFSPHYCLHSWKSAISLSLKTLPYQPRLARNPFQVRILIRPMHLFGRSVDHDYYFELLREEERDAQSHVRKKAEVLSGRLSPLG
jgi:hypothetical protein